MKFKSDVDVEAALAVSGGVTVTDSATGVNIDSSGHASLKLDRGSTSYDNNIMFSTAGDTKFRIWQDGDADYLYIRDDDNGTNMVTFKKGGNVGIGTTSPSSNLEISDSTQATGATLSITNAHSGSWAIGDKIGSIDFRIDDASATEFVRAKIHAEGLTTGTFPSDSQLAFSTANGNTLSEKMRITSAGNVGIGTNSPALTYGGKGLHIQNDDIAGIMLYDTTGAKFNISARSGDVLLYANSAVPIRIGTTSSERMRIEADGDIGIGTTAPVGKLSVNEAGSGVYFTRSSGDNGTNAPVIAFANDSTKSIIATAGDGLVFRTRAVGGAAFSGSEAMRITNAGNVGIGTTSPGAKLSIAAGASDANTEQIRFNRTNDEFRYNSIFSTISSSSSTAKISFGVHDGVTSTSQATVMSLLGNGNVGIGTTSPTTSYSKVLQINAAGNGSTLRLTDVGSGSAVNSGLELLQYGVDSYIINRENGVMRFWNNNSSKMVILANGNVGINNTAPAYELDVVGTIRASGDVIAYSDARVKENVETIPNALDKVKAMRGVGYNKIGEKRRSMGVIAQELLEVLPEVVHQDEQGMYSVAYGNIVGVLIEAMKEQQSQISELKEKIDGLTK